MTKALILWGVLVLSGFGYLMRYSATAGATAERGVLWPRDSRVQRDPERPTLLLFLHPACPCSRATIEELSRLVTQVGPMLDTHALCIRPEGMAEGWERTDVWRSAERLPYVQVAVDVQGDEARRFGALTSGYVVLYDTQGRLVFRGGITAARGHVGSNMGGEAIVSWIRQGRIDNCETPVFGCPLFDE